MGATGKNRLTGTYAEIQLDGLNIAESTKIEIKIKINREAVYVGSSIDQKLISTEGEGTIEINKVYSRMAKYIEEFTKGKDPRVTIIASLKDPDAVGGQTERWSIDDVAFGELPVITAEKGAVMKESIPFTFAIRNLKNLDKIKEI